MYFKDQENYFFIIIFLIFKVILGKLKMHFFYKYICDYKI